MPDILSSAMESFEGALILGKRTFRSLFWILVPVAVLDYEARWLATSALVMGSNGSPLIGGQLVAILLLSLDLAILTTVFLFILPYQDCILRGQAAGVRVAYQILSRRIWPLAVSSTIQTILVLALPLVLCIIYVKATIAALHFDFAPDLVMIQTVALDSVRRAMWPSLAWIAVSSALLMFAVPYVVLENRGPVRSIALSVSLVIRRFKAELGRFSAIAALWAGVSVAVLLPASLPSFMSTATPRDSIIIAFFSAAWRSLAMALALPWYSAGLVVLFRHLVPDEQ